MKKSGIWGGIICSLALSFPTFAQYASDAFRFSEINQNGSARFQGLGGNHAALGADPSSISGNPAGLGFYNRSEASISPGFRNIGTQSNYINRTTSDNSSKFSLAQQASLVITSKPSFQRRWKRTSFGISYSSQQSFQNRFSYSGTNNRSAYVDQVVEDVNRSKVTAAQLEADFESDPSKGGPLAYAQDAAYYQLFLINPSSTGGAPYTRFDKSSPTEQNGTFEATGGHSQWTLAYGGNYNDKLYVGGSFGINRIKYAYTNVLDETYVKGTTFNGATQSEAFNVNGNGVNFTLGIIYKLSPVVQLGGSLTSPTWTAMRNEVFSQSVQADYIEGSIRDKDGKDIGPVNDFIPVAPNEFEYSIASPLKGSAGATFFLGKKGFITGTMEYVGYGGMGVKTKYLSSAGNSSFRSDTKAEIQDTYRNVFNGRVGGEFRTGILRVRAGIAYLADPYLRQFDGIKRDRILYSGGVGVRNSRFFADLTGTFSGYKSSFSPYVLNNTQDYSSVKITNKSVNVMATIGTFF